MDTKGKSIANEFVKTEIIGTQFTNATANDILKYILHHIAHSERKVMIVTPNPEIVVYAKKHHEFQKILNQAQISLADGTGIQLASLLLGRPIIERITGVDFMLEICKNVADKPVNIGLLGGQTGIAHRTAERLRKMYPGIKIVFAEEEWSGKRDDSPRHDGDRRSDPPTAHHSLMPIDFLFVAFGFPKQEEWIYHHLPHIPVKVAMGVGGAFDYISGNTHRAPWIIRLLGFEWLYRLIIQPWRWRRQLALVKFMKLTLLGMFHKV